MITLWYGGIATVRKLGWEGGTQWVVRGWHSVGKVVVSGRGEGGNQWEEGGTQWGKVVLIGGAW